MFRKSSGQSSRHRFLAYTSSPFEGKVFTFCGASTFVRSQVNLIDQTISGDSIMHSQVNPQTR